MDEAEQTTQDLRLNFSHELAEAMRPLSTRESESTAQHVHQNNELWESDVGNLLSRQGTPFRPSHRPQNDQQDMQPGQDNGQLRITAPARLFTVHESPYTQRQERLDETDSSVDYQHHYSQRALAAQERRRRRRQQYAEEESVFYDAEEASLEFDQYRQIAMQSSPTQRIREYRKLCGYSENVPTCGSFPPPRPQRKGCLIRPSSKVFSKRRIAGGGGSENIVNASSVARFRSTPMPDGYTTPIASPDPGNDSITSKRVFAQAFGSVKVQKRVRFAPLCAAEFDADEPAHALTPLPPKQAAKLEEEIKNRKILADESLRVVQQQRMLEFDPVLHQTTLENNAILSRWESFDPDQGAESSQHRQRQRRRSSGKFSPLPGSHALLQQEDYQELAEAPCEDESVTFEESTSFEGHNDSLLLENNQEYMINNEMIAESLKPWGKEASSLWMNLLKDPGNFDASEATASDVWNDLLLAFKLLQPSVDECAWIELFTEHQCLADIYAAIFYKQLKSSTENLKLSEELAVQAEGRFAVAELEIQERCVDSAELSWVELELQGLHELEHKILALTDSVTASSRQLDKLETEMDDLIAILPRKGQRRLAAAKQKQVDVVEQELEEIEKYLQDLIGFEQILMAVLSEYLLALRARATTILAPSDIDEDEGGDIIIVKSPVQGLSMRLYRAFDDQEYSIQVIERSEDNINGAESPRTFAISHRHQVATFYRWMLSAIIRDCHGLDFCDCENVLELTSRLNRLRLVALDLLEVCHFFPVSLHNPMEGRLIIVDVALPNGLRLHVFYDMEMERCMSWFLPSLVQVIQSDQLAMADPPPVVAYAMNVTNVSACRFILTELCNSLDLLPSHEPYERC